MAAAQRLVHRLRRPVRRERVFRDRTNPLDVYDDMTLFERFRFPRPELLKILDEYGAELEYLATRKGSLPATLQILIAMRFFATGSFQMAVGDIFGVSKATVHRCIHRVSSEIARRVSVHVRFDRQTKADRTKEKFLAMAGFPNVVGCVDCTHVHIIAPTVNEHEFVNRKGYHSIHVQVVCDADLKILNCVAKWPGSVDEARILRESAVFPAFQATPPALDGFLLGDAGYPPRPWLLTPYGSATSPTRRRYNEALRATWETVKRCNTALKQRWHCLHGELRYAPEKVCQIIMACAVLHNKANAQRLRLPDGECTDDCNHDDQDDYLDDGNDNDSDSDDDVDDDELHPSHNLTGCIMRDRIAQEYFQR